MKYKVLVQCKNDKTGKTYLPNAFITDKTFKKIVIKNWLKCVPPVLEKVVLEEEGGNDDISGN